MKINPIETSILNTLKQKQLPTTIITVYFTYHYNRNIQ